MPAELEIAPDGTVLTVYADALLPILAELGPLHVERASHVEFDNARGQWGVWTQAGNDTGERFGTRAEALDWEVRNITALLDGPGRGGRQIVANTGSNQHFFGLGHGRVTDKNAERISKVATEHGADFIRHADPQCSCGYGCRPFACRKSERYWFASPNRGEPFDSATAHEVIEALTTAGLWPVQTKK